MYKLDLPKDLKEEAARERRRTLELERQNRIFNAKVRTIGIDKQSVEEQVKIRKNQEQQERERDEAFANDMIRNDKIAELLQRRQEQDIRNLNQALVEFRGVHQQPDSRREWDLNDPDAKMKDRPARVTDDDPRCGVASIQKFEGEDLNGDARKKLMQEQMREWAKMSNEEKNRARAREEEAARLHDLHRREMDQRACELAAAEEECRKAINKATTDYNLALNDEQSEKRRLAEEEELDNNFTEMANLINGDMLTENPDVAQSAFGPHRVITDRWKGMSPEQIAEVRRMQELQRQEKKQQREEEEQRDREWDAQRMADARVATLMEREQERMRKAQEKHQAESNNRLSTDQKAHIEYLDTVVYTNPPTASYFQQFNTTSR